MSALPNKSNAVLRITKVIFDTDTLGHRRLICSDVQALGRKPLLWVFLRTIFF